jgi:IS30 family transposase
LSGFDQIHLDRAAASLKERPRKALDFATSPEQVTNLLADLASANRSSAGRVRSGI